VAAAITAALVPVAGLPALTWRPPVTGAAGAATPARVFWHPRPAALQRPAVAILGVSGLGISGCRTLPTGPAASLTAVPLASAAGLTVPPAGAGPLASTVRLAGAVRLASAIPLAGTAAPGVISAVTSPPVAPAGAALPSAALPPVAPASGALSRTGLPSATAACTALSCAALSCAAAGRAVRPRVAIPRAVKLRAVSSCAV
jgi:hypothetical protein